METGANAPSKSRLQATSGGCENVRLRVNHTICMPAKVGPKRDRALTRAGCYFDGTAATRGANAFSICGERGICFRSTRLCAQEPNSASYPRRCERKATKPSIAPHGKYGLHRSARNEIQSVALSWAPETSVALRSRPARQPRASPPLANVNIDIEINLAHAALRRQVRAAFMPAAFRVRAPPADVRQLEASPLRQRP